MANTMPLVYDTLPAPHSVPAPVNWRSERTIPFVIQQPKAFDAYIRKPGSPTCVLTLVADANLSSDSPVYLEGVPVQGIVQLQCDKVMDVRSVVVKMMRTFEHFAVPVCWANEIPLNRLISSFGYIPLIRPPILPIMRQRAYLGGLPLASPHEDPQSWYQLPPTDVMGRADSRRPSRPVICTLYLANPLSYTRGSLIPLFVEIDDGMQGAVNSLSSLSTIRVCLMQRSMITRDRAEEMESSKWKLVKDASNMAVWWGSSPLRDNSNHNVADQRRRLNGELSVPTYLLPTTHILNLRIDVSHDFVLLPFIPVIRGHSSSSNSKFIALKRSSLTIIRTPKILLTYIQPEMSFESIRSRENQHTPSNTSPASNDNTSTSPSTTTLVDVKGQSSPQLELKEFFYELKNSGRPYLQVTFVANGRFAKALPTIVQGTNVTGNVSIHLDKGEDIRAITGIVQGKLIYGSHEGGGKSLVFLKIVKEFYSRPSNSQQPSGVLCWTFDIELPRTVTIKSSEKPEESNTFDLPQTTQERQSRASTVYEMIVQVTRGKFKSDKELSFPFNYIPVTPPPSLPVPRSNAYRQGALIPNPSSDEEGWSSLGQYSVILVTPMVPGFQSREANSSQVLASKQIKVVTAYAPGPRPNRTIPPSNQSLEQIFLHRGKDFSMQYKPFRVCAYMALTPLIPREYTIEEKGAPLLVTTLYVSGNTPPHANPTYTQQEEIKGDVRLTLQKPTKVKKVMIVIRGKLAYGTSDMGSKVLWFYQRKTTLWAREQGQPTNSESPRTPSQIPDTTMDAGKLLGTYIWNFSIPFPPPSQVLQLLPVNGKSYEKPEFKLPHTFQESFNVCYVVYHAYVELHRGGFSDDKEMVIPINFVPVIVPPPIPHLRQMAYQDGRPILGPSADPNGWTALETVNLQGRLFQQREATVACTLYVANPLCYTRGTVIPLYLELEGDDVQALDLLASSSAPLVRLKRTVNSHPQPKSRSTLPSFKPLTNYSHPAVWWSTSADALPASPGSAPQYSEPGKRSLQGELHLKNNLVPTSAVGHFWLEYSVILLPSRVTGFEPLEKNPEKPLAEKRVEIVTAYAPGVRPIRMAPISYEEAQEVLQEKDITLRNKITLRTFQLIAIMTTSTPAPVSADPPYYVDATLSALNDDEPSFTADGVPLPAYPGARPVRAARIREPSRLKEFKYKINRNGRNWACMTVSADEAISKVIPTYVEGESIQGQVELQTEKSGDDIRGVVVSVIGEVIMGVVKGERFKFLELSQTLWSREMGDPHQLGSRSPQDEGQPDLTGAQEAPIKYTQKLMGQFSWKFDFKLPKEVSLRNGKEMGTFRLPQTQSERYTRACVQYEVSVRFIRGRMRSDNKIGAVIGFIPIIRPPPFSPLRQLAYQECLPNLLGPSVDTDGWYAGEPIRVKGTIFGVRSIDISCQLHLAKPVCVLKLLSALADGRLDVNTDLFTCKLSYTRGSSIPLCLTLDGSDKQALDLLSGTNAPVVRLQRRMRYSANVEKDLRNLTWKDSFALSKAAIWWHAPDNTHDARRTINGELHLKPELKPTSAMAQFRIEYSVVLFPFDVAGFESKDRHTEPLLEQPVDIVTAYAEGPRPRKLTPPGYEHAESLHSMGNRYNADATMLYELLFCFLTPTMDVSSPPRYRRFSSRPGPAPSSATELPPYTRRNTLAQPINVRREPTEHIFQLSDGKSRPWLTLTVFSSAKSSKSLPTFFEKENITGRLEIQAERGDSIQAVSATVTGRIITGSSIDDSSVFLSQTLPIWSKSPDAPRLPSPSEGASSNKLLGHCVWPLNIPLARSVNFPSGAGDTRSFRLPETFLERHTRVSVQYDLTITISRGLLRSDNKLTTAFGYVPSTKPEPPSLLRQLAYQQFLPLPGPSSDPEGWKTLRPVNVRGTLFSKHRVEAKCILSIAKPLCYSRGSVLPCFLTLEGNNTQALDLLSNPGSVLVRLRRRVRFYNKATTSRQDVAWNESVEDLGTATWWPATDMQNDSTSRHLEGEIKLEKDLRPTSEMGHFSISEQRSTANEGATRVALVPSNGDNLPPDYTRRAVDSESTQASPLAPQNTSNGVQGCTTEHQRSLETAKGRKWLSIFVKSRAGTPASLPVFFQGDVIAGRVEIDLDKAESSKGVTISIQAGTTFVGQEEEVFLKDEKSLWIPSGNDGGKLSGKRSWPFEFSLPDEVQVKNPDTGKTSPYRLPPHFNERASAAYIDYRLVVTIKRGFLRVNQTLVTSFGYHIATTPGLPSTWRRIAYSEGTPLLGPDADPEGWKLLPWVTNKVKLFNSQDVQFESSLAIATPLEYGGGTTIPLVMTIKCQNEQLLDLLSDPSTVRVRLARSLSTGADATDDNAIRRTDNHFIEEVGRAFFWVSPTLDKDKREFQGEIEVTKDLKPSFVFPRFTVRYSLDVQPFVAVGLANTVPESSVVLSEKVSIMSRATPGLRSRSYAPPGYRKTHIDYNKSVGLLENGNQRFLGHHHR
ncbi:hypothetical protein CVT24_002194 [Panaeolus cyanescens]|uniref:Arrestin-like N-terminal domain-containing protein n=1 Tax=Panaeolus cyanescens TaxID=181874 RepID=A0A409YHX2_9AGAR|nr:hypothetical protein CVT24_002194 [Panaeolus cyanescens]